MSLTTGSKGVGLMLDFDLYNKIKALSVLDCRTLSGMIRVCIEEHVNKRMKDGDFSDRELINLEVRNSMQQCKKCFQWYPKHDKECPYCEGC